MKATLGDFPLDTDQDVSWSLTEGTRPHQRFFLMSKTDAEKLIAKDGPVSLVIDGSPDYPKLEVKDLYVMSIQPASTPFHRQVLVADKRIWWQRAHVLRRYNVVKRGPDMRRLYQEGTPVGFNRNIQSDKIYAAWSLYPRAKPSDPWNAEQVLRDVIGAVEPGQLEFANTFDKSVSIQNLVIDDQGDTAVGQALKFIPGACLYVRADGVVVVYHENKGGESGILAAKPPLVGPPLAAPVSLAKSRPVASDVLFGRELEVRFDSRVEGFLGTRSAEVREMVNVAPVPDSTLRVNGKILTCGTWVSFDNLFTAWAGDWPTQAPSLTHAITQKLWSAPVFIDAYARSGLGGMIEPRYVRRLSAVTSHYRQTFQLEPKWRDRILALKAYRVGILDEENGVRASAQAFADYSIQPTLRGAARSAQDNSALAYNVNGYAPLLADAKVAPARVTVLDEDQGVIRIDYMLDLNGLYARVFPSGIVGPDGTVNSLPRADARPVNGVNYLAEHAILAPSHRVAVVLTAVPAAPNDERQLYAHRVEKSDAEAALGLTIGECKGPVWKVRVSDSVLQARWEWLDSKAQDVEKVFGVESSAPSLIARTVGRGRDPLGEPNNNASVKGMAEAIAAAIYSAFLDRGEGTHVVALNPEIHPTGSASSVTHTLQTDGKALTIASMPGRAEAFDMLALLPESVRNLIQRIVQ